MNLFSALVPISSHPDPHPDGYDHHRTPCRAIISPRTIKIVPRIPPHNDEIHRDKPGVARVAAPPKQQPYRSPRPTPPGATLANGHGPAKACSNGNGAIGNGTGAVHANGGTGGAGGFLPSKAHPVLPTAVANGSVMVEPESTSRVKKILHVTDQHTKILGYRVLNSQLSLYIGMLQLVVCVWALTQHVYSIYVYDEILFCDFVNITTTGESRMLVGVDAIIFDIGLFHSLWGIHGCVAQHLDGGYGRFAWCICHTLVLVCCLPLAFVNRPRPYLMWPLLVQQSAYGIGLLILSLAALPRILPTFMGDLKNAPIYSIMFYLVGASLNYVLLYVYYHWYWHVDAEYNSAKKLTTNETEAEEIVDPRRRPFHYDRFIDKPFIPRPRESTSATPSPMTMSSAPHTSRTMLEVYPNGFVKQAPMLPVKQPPPPPSNVGGGGYYGTPNGYNGTPNGYPTHGAYCNGDIPSYHSSSQRPSLTSNASSHHQLPAVPYQQQSRQLPPPRRAANNMNGHLLLGAGATASGSDQENAYTSDDSAATTALASGTCCHYYDHHNQIRAATASPFASTAAARYNKFIHTSGQVSYRKTSLTPGGAPLSGGRVVGISPVTTPMYAHHRNGVPISVSCTNSPKWSRHGTPTNINDMPNTII